MENDDCLKIVKLKRYILIFFFIVALIINGLSAISQTPTIVSFTPNTGSVGTLVTITGTNMTNPTSLSIGGVQALVVTNTGSQLVAMVMPGSITGNVSITTIGGNASGSGNFTVIASQPPFTQQGNKLFGTGGIGSSIYQAWASALSADGNTAIVGGPFDKGGRGAVWIYTRSGNVWSQQGAKIVATDTIGDPYQGWSVAVSADGNTALIGAPFDNNGYGASWVFTRSGNTWTQQGNKLLGTGGIGATVYQGYSVSLSADGNTALIGGPYDNNFQGAAWVFKRNGTTWTQQGSKFTGTGNVGVAAFGWSVALSADGKTALAGGYYDNNNLGAAWVFTTNGTTWSQQGSKLVGTGSVGATVFQGYSIAINANGNTAIIGGTNDDNGMGAAWVFTRSGTTWSQQGSKLVGTGSVGSSPSQGNSVTISADGNTAMIGGNYDDGNNGATWVFTRTGNTWSQRGNKLMGTGSTGAAQQGYSVCISANGNNAIIGGYSDNSFKGAAWIFVPASSNADLVGLTMSPGSLVPVFASATVTYNSSVSNATSSVTVTPIASEINSTIQVRVNNGSYSSVSSGTISGSLPLNVGANIIDVLVTAQDGNTTKTYTITVNRSCPGISAVLSGNASICSGNSSNLSVAVTGGTSPFAIVYSGGTVNNYTSGANIPVSPTGTTNYTLTSVTDANSCTGSVSGTALVTIKTIVGITNVTAVNNPICPGSTTTLNANGVVGTNNVVTWWTGSGGTGTNLGTGSSLPLVSQGTYYARVTGDCGSPVEANITITLATVPVVENKTASICSGKEFIIKPTGVPVGTKYSWGIPTYSGTISGGSAQNLKDSISQTLVNSDVTNGTATYTVTPSVGACNGNQFTATVTVYPLPIPTFTISPPDTTCASDNVTYTTQAGMSNYIWVVPGIDGTDYTVISGGIGVGNNSVTVKWLTGGTKNVRVSYTNGNNCVASSAANSLTYINTGLIPSVSKTITAGNNPACASTSITFTAISQNGGNSPTYQWYKNGVADPLGTNAVYTINAISNANAPAVYVKMTVTPGLCVTTPSVKSDTTQISIVSNSWTGAFNNIWSDTRNWCAGTVPGGISDISIPVTASYPIISGNAAVRNIHIENGASVTLGIGTLTVNGVVSGTGTFGGILLSGLIFTNSGNIGSLFFANGGIGSVKLTGSGAIATLGNKTDIYNELNIGSATLNTADLLTFKSTINGTAWLGPILGAGAVIGKVTVERYIPQNAFRAWRLLSVPVKGTQTFKQAWQENQAPLVNAIPGYGTLLTSTLGGGGYDAATSGNSLLQFTNGTPGTFSGVTNTNNIMQTTSGYFVYIRGDRGALISAGSFNPTPTTLRTNGELYIGTQSVVSVPPSQNVMIGNVYAAPIDFDFLVKSGITAFKVWDPKLQGSSNVGAYQTFSALNGYDPIPGGGSFGSTANSQIQSGQAFIVSSATGGTLQLTESAKASGSKNVFRTTKDLQQFKTRLIVHTADSDQVADGNSVLFDSKYSNDIDDVDVIKASNFGENFSLESKGRNFVIQGRKSVIASDTINYCISNLKMQQYILEFIPQNLDQNLVAYLEDKFEGTRKQIDLLANSRFTFKVNSNTASFAPNRFRILFKNKISHSGLVRIQAYQKDKNIQVDWMVSLEQNVKNYEVEYSTDGIRYFKVSTVKATNKGSIEQNYLWLHEKPVIGDNYYRVKCIFNTGEHKYTTIAKVTISNGNSFSIYPNPVVNQTINLQLNNQPAGNYNIRLINNDGKNLLATIIRHSGGTGNYKINLPTAIINGNYKLEIRSEKYLLATENLVISNQE